MKHLTSMALVVGAWQVRKVISVSGNPGTDPWPPQAVGHVHTLQDGLDHWPFFWTLSLPQTNSCKLPLCLGQRTKLSPDLA